ncbi:hypothetical protein GCM10009558_103910 [Virgisporangium aurantiacum]
MVLDPGTNKYYVAGIVVGAALWDLLGLRAALPWCTAAACLGLFTARFVPMPDHVHCCSAGAGPGGAGVAWSSQWWPCCSWPP